MIKKFLSVFAICILSLSINSAFAEQENFVDTTIQGLLQEKITDHRVTVEPQYNSTSKINELRKRENKIKTIILEKFDPRYSSFRARVNYTDESSDSVSGKYFSYIMAPVASRYIKPNEIIQSGDIALEKTRLDNLRRGYATESSEVIGMRANKYIAVGKMFKMNEMSNPPVIKNNDPVSIIYSSGSINLKTLGTALNSGAVGDMVKVRNDSSGSILLGKIIDKNTVKVGDR